MITRTYPEIFYSDKVEEIWNHEESRMMSVWLKKRKSDSSSWPRFECCNESDNEYRKVGLSEDFFYKQLKETLPSSYRVRNDIKIFLGISYRESDTLIKEPRSIFSRPNDEDDYVYRFVEEEVLHYYYPDIAIMADGVFIDVEIDEPYSKEIGNPIHYISDDGSSSIDDNRNTYMRAGGWEVIRFAEEQVIKHPKTCIMFIKKVLDNLLSAHSFRPRLDFAFPIRRWTETQAATFSLTNYRDTYIRDLYNSKKDSTGQKNRFTQVKTADSQKQWRTEYYPQSFIDSIKMAAVRNKTIVTSEGEQVLSEIIFFIKEQRPLKERWDPAIPAKKGNRVDIHSIRKMVNIITGETYVTGKILPRVASKSGSVKTADSQKQWKTEYYPQSFVDSIKMAFIRIRTIETPAGEQEITTIGFFIRGQKPLSEKWDPAIPAKNGNRVDIHSIRKMVNIITGETYVTGKILPRLVNKKSES